MNWWKQFEEIDCERSYISFLRMSDIYLFYSLKEQFSLENRSCSEHFMKWKTQGRKYQIAGKRFVFMHYPSCVT